MPRAAAFLALAGASGASSLAAMAPTADRLIGVRSRAIVSPAYEILEQGECLKSRITQADTLKCHNRQLTVRRERVSSRKTAKRRKGFTMGLFDFIKDSTRELFIARPEEARGQLFYKHPDTTIPNHAKVTIEADEVGLFFAQGTNPVVIPPGQHPLESTNIPFLKNLINIATDGNVFRAELYFITMRELTSFTFGGPVGNVEDPDTGEGVDLMVNGTFSLHVVDPVHLMVGLVGLRVNDNDGTRRWLRELLMKYAIPAIASLVAKKEWPL